MNPTFEMSNCYSGEFASGSALAWSETPTTPGKCGSDGECWIMLTFTLCMWISMMSSILYIANWTKSQIDSVYCEIHDQQEEIMGFTQEKHDNLVKLQNDKVERLEEENAELRAYAIEMETKVTDVRSMLQFTETMASNLQGDVAANHANIGQRIVSLRCQSIRDLHALEDATKMKNDELLRTMDALSHRMDDLERQCHSEDEYKQVLIGYYDNSGIHPLFCPKHTTELDKYLGNKRVSLILTSLAQLPNYKTFTFADYFYKREGRGGVKPISSFLDLHMNVIANAVEWGRAQEVREPELVSHYKTAFERVKEYCQTFGVKCV